MNRVVPQSGLIFSEFEYLIGREEGVSLMPRFGLASVPQPRDVKLALPRRLAFWCGTQAERLCYSWHHVLPPSGTERGN